MAGRAPARREARRRWRDRWFMLAVGVSLNFAGAALVYLIVAGVANVDDLTGVALLGAMALALGFGLLILFRGSTDL